MDESVATWPAVRLAAAIREGRLSSRELLETYLHRIERLNPAVNAVITLDAERALSAAAAADAALARGDELGPLHGLPFTVKDAIETLGILSTGGAPELSDHVPQRDAPAVARLKAAGAIVFGKTNAPQWSADIETFNDLFGTTGNPWNVAYTAGGSSGGSAAAVAAGLTSFDLGTDVGGSIRMPSHACGVYGLKPSFGVVPQRGYLDHVGGGTTDTDVNVFGPIARGAEDLDLLLRVLAAPPPELEAAWRVELPPCDLRGLEGLRVGAWLDDPACPIEREYHARLRAAAEALANAGAEVSHVRPPVPFEEHVALYFRMLAKTPGPSGTAGSHGDWLRAEEERMALRHRWAEWFTGYDLLVCPVLAMSPFPHVRGQDIRRRTITIDGTSRLMMDTVGWSLVVGIAALPSVVAPIGRTGAGMPVGMQFVAPYLQDRRAVAVAALAASALGGYAVPPGC
jgi:amidase